MPIVQCPEIAVGLRGRVMRDVSGTAVRVLVHRRLVVGTIRRRPRRRDALPEQRDTQDAVPENSPPIHERQYRPNNESSQVMRSAAVVSFLRNDARNTIAGRAANSEPAGGHHDPIVFAP